MYRNWKGKYSNTPFKRIADKSWVIVQKKTFTNWVNSQLLQGNHPVISDVAEDFVNGVSLLRLLEVIGGASLERYNHTPKLRIQKVENVNKALNFIHSRGVNLTNIGAEDIVDGNQKLILGLVWMIILKFSISYISEEGYEAKDALLLWCQRQVVPYENDFKINDFTYSWKSGLGIIQVCTGGGHPLYTWLTNDTLELLDYHSLDKTAAKVNTELALDVAEKQLKIPKLFEASDITDVEKVENYIQSNWPYYGLVSLNFSTSYTNFLQKPDERSIVTYLAQFFHSFTAEERKKKAALKIAKFAHDMKACYCLKDDYEARFAKLKHDILEKLESWDRIDVNSHSVAGSIISDLKNFRSGQKNEWAAERKKLWMLLGTIQVKRSTYELEPYNPPEGYLPKDMSIIWNDFIIREKALYDSCFNFILSYKESLRKSFRTLLETLADDIEVIMSHISQIHETVPNLEEQLVTVNNYLSKTESMYNDATLLEQYEAECDEARVYNKGELAPGTSKEIKYELDTLVSLAEEKISIIKSQIEARKISDLDRGRLMELTETFHCMDKDKDGKLNKEELSNALKAEGLDVDEKTLDDLYDNVLGKDGVTYESFIDYMKREAAVLSNEQIIGLFKTVSSGKKYVTHSSLLECGISRAAVEDICAVIPTDEDGNLNYEQFLENNLTKSALASLP